MKQQYRLTVRQFFDASHQLPDTEYLVTKACARLHGHTYAVEVDASAEQLRGGMVVDFKAIKQVIDTLDHRHINEVFTERGYNEVSTAENIAKYIAHECQREMPDIVITEVRVCEGYKGRERASWAIYQPTT